MFNYDKNNITEQTLMQCDKETYIANLLLRCLYSENVNNSECYRIIKKFKDIVLGSDTII